MLEENTRPRVARFGEGAVLILRGVNLSEEEPEEELIALRVWLEAERVITARMYPFKAVRELRAAIEAGGEVPTRTSAWAAWLADGLTRRLVERVEEIEEETLDLFERVGDATHETAGAISSELSRVRNRAVHYRRYIGPQRDAYEAFASLQLGWICDSCRAELREQAQRVGRLVEALDAALARGELVQQRLDAIAAERLALVTGRIGVLAAVAVPATLLTGLLGVNVEGIPFSDRPWAFTGVCTLGVASIVGLVYLLKRSRWL